MRCRLPCVWKGHTIHIPDIEIVIDPPYNNVACIRGPADRHEFVQKTVLLLTAHAPSLLRPSLLIPCCSALLTSVSVDALPCSVVVLRAVLPYGADATRCSPLGVLRFRRLCEHSVSHYLCTNFEMKPVNFVHLLSALQATMIGDTRLLSWLIDREIRVPTSYKKKSHNPDDSSTLYNLTSEHHNWEAVLLFVLASICWVCTI